MNRTHQQQQEQDETCVMCDKPGKYRCTICNGPMYCGEEHQRFHWTRHEAKCNVMYTKDKSTVALMPYDLVDEQGLPTSVRSMLCCTDDTGAQHVDVIESKVGELDVEKVEARRWSFFGSAPRNERAPAGTPKIVQPGLMRGIGPDEGVGAGRAPTEAEKDNGNGNVKVTIEFWRSYMDKSKDRPADGRWEAIAIINDSNVIYQANTDERVRQLANLRVDRERGGLVVWFDEAALDQKKIDLPVNGGYVQMTIKTSWNNREMSTNMVYGRTMRAVRAFGVGWTARKLLQAKGLNSRSDRVLYMHDKRIGSDVRVSMVVRTATGSRVMRLVDMEVFIPDLKGVSTEDSALDADYPITIPMDCDITNQEQIDGLVCALKEELAFLSTAEQELVRSPIPLEPEERDLLMDAQFDKRRVSSWLDVIEQHAARLQEEGPGFVGASYGETHSDLYQATNQALTYLHIDGKRWDRFKSAFRKGKDKVMTKGAQRQYEYKIKSEGPQWALDKLGDADWQQNPKKLRNLKKALQRVKRTSSWSGTKKKRLDESMRLVDQYLAVHGGTAADGANDDDDDM